MTKLKEFWPDAVETVLVQLESSGYKAYLVGGCVRDYYLGRSIHDYDIATDALPEQVLNVFPHVKATGLKHGTVTVVQNGTAVEVTTYRIDGKYSDGRRPDTVHFTRNIEDDLARRDYSINAMAFHRKHGLLDPFHGLTDIRAGVLRTVGVPRERFAEDSLRIMRGIRFAAQLGFEIHPDTLGAMYECSRDLRFVSAERIGQELMKMAIGNWWKVLVLLQSGPWLLHTTPSLDVLQHACSLLLPYEPAGDLWLNEVEQVGDGSLRPVDEIKCTAFLTTLLLVLRETDESRRLIQVMERLAWPKRISREARISAELLETQPHDWSLAQWRRNLFDFGPETVLLTVHLHQWVQRTHNLENPSEPVALYQGYLDTQPLFQLRDLNIDGRAIQGLGAEGPAIGVIKRRLAMEVLDGNLPNDEQTLRQRAAALIKELYTR